MADTLFPGTAATTNAAAPADPLFKGQSQPKADPKATVEAIAKRNRIPVNYLFAATEAAGATTPEEQAQAAEAIAARYAPRIAAGENIKDIVRSDLREKAEPFIARAQQIAAEMYPAQWAEKVKKIEAESGGVGAALGAGVDMVAQGYGSAVEGLGRVTGLQGVEDYGNEIAAVRGGRVDDAGQYLKSIEDIGGVGDVAQFTGEQVAQNAPQMATSMGGAAAGAAIGSFVPGVGTGIGALIGGLAVNLPFFYGMNRERQKQEGAPGEKVEVSEGAAALTAIPQAALDTIVDKVLMGMGPTPAIMEGGGIFTRAAKGVVGGAVVETPTEVGQQLLERMQAGLPIADDEAIKEYRDTAIAAGLIGGAVGGVSNAATKPKGTMRTVLDQGRDGNTVRPALPSPTNGGTIFGEGPVTVPPEPRDPTQFERQPGQPRTPKGEMGAATAASPGPLLGAPAGTPLQVTSPDLDGPINGVLTSETPLAVTITTADGEVLEIPRGEIDAGGVSITLAPPDEAPAEAPVIQEGKPPIVTDAPVIEETAPAASVAPRTIETAPPASSANPAAARDDMTAEQARARLAYLQDQARTNGWDARLRTMHDEVAKIVARFDKADQDAANAASGIITKKDGTPFKTETQARRALGNLGYGVDGYDIIPQGDGFVAAPKSRSEQQDGSVEPLSGVQEADAGVPAVDARKPRTPRKEPSVSPPAAEVAVPSAPVEPAKPRLDVAPMAPADTRSQPDMLGGRDVPENELAAKEKRRREWGQFLGIATHGGSDWDGELEGRDVRIRRGRVRILAGDKPGPDDPILDAQGMSREEISGWTREVMNRLGPAPEKAPTPAAAKSPDAGADAPRGAVQGDTGAAAGSAAVPTKANPAAGKTYRLDQSLSDKQRKTLAKARDTDAGEVLGEIDNAVRRAAVELRAKGVDIDALDERGRDASGQFHQMGVMVREGETAARDLLDHIAEAKGEPLDFPNRDEDSGEWEFDGSPLSNALEWLEGQYAMGLGVDEVTAPGPNSRLDGDTTPMPKDQIFPAGKGTVSLDGQADRQGFIPQEEADARIAAWKKVAADIGKTDKNKNKVVISIFDYTGAWVQPWRDAGYTILQHDIKTGSDLLTDAWIRDRIEEVRAEGFEVYGVLSACPCTTFAGSGARWWQDLHDKESPEALKKVFGDRALSSGAKSPVEYNLMLVDATRDVIELAAPTGFHVLENPIGRIETAAKLPPPRARFHPYNFGNPYTKRTQLFGDFQTDLPFANVDPIEGSKVQATYRGDDPLGKEARSTTPEGFAYAFFMANDPDAREAKDSSDQAATPSPAAVPTAQEFTAAAAETDPNPTDAQKEAENYKTGKINWNGLTLSIENAKGSTRSGTAPDGSTWSVKMPAHYGRILRTEGADGDHVDFYMGPRPDSDLVVVVDQKDESTGKFDEHKVMLGFANRKAALDFYVQGFSDGKGADRMGGHKILTVAEFKDWLANGDQTKPVRAEVKEPPAAAPAGPRVFINKIGKDGLTDAERAAGKAPYSDPEPAQSELPMPKGYALGSVQKMNKDRAARSSSDPEANSGNWVAGDFHAVISRQSPYSIVGGYGKTRVEAINDAIRRTNRNQPTQEAEGRATTYPQVDPPFTKKEAFAAGQKAFRDKFARDLPAPFDSLASEEVREEWYRGWDAANLAAPVEPPKPDRPKIGDPNYTLADAEADLMDARNAYDAEGMVKNARTGERMRKLQDLVKQMKEEAKAAEVSVTQKPDDAPASTAYGASNKLVTADRAAELRDRLKAKLRDQLNSGIDPEILAIGAELAVFHIEAGARRFADLAKAVASDLGTTPQKIRPYLRAWYNSARDLMEDGGASIDGMDGPDEVRAALAALDSGELPVSQEPAESATISADLPKEAPDDLATDGSNDGSRAGKGEGDRSARAGQAGGNGEGDAAADAGKPRAERAPRKRSERRADDAGEDLFRRAGGVDGELERQPPKNHVIQAGELEVKAGDKTRAKNSIAAIQLLKQLQREGRPATAEERTRLALYGGAGTLSGALPRSDGTFRFPDLAGELKALLTEEEYKTLSRTSQYAFYTAEPALRSMWTLAKRLGFKGGRVYEPGMGVGGFPGTMPADLRSATRYTGLELDHVTAQIAAALYPEHTIRQGDFIKTTLPRGYYDMVIGNPPFAGTKIQSDLEYPQGFMLHDYFFAKSLDAVRPGGLLVYITSAGTMNKMDGTARDYLADRADLVGAIRLPNTAFKENGTEVTTDIIVLRKRLEGEKEASPAWRSSDVIEVPNAEGSTGEAAVNRYFIEHPEMILGEQGLFDTLTAGDRIGVRPRPGSDFKADLQAAVKAFPENVMSEATAAEQLGALDVDTPETKTGSYYLKDGEIYQFDGRTGQKVEQRSRENTKGVPKADMETIRALIPVKMALREVYAADLNETDATEARRRLNEAYDAFVAKRGPINLEVRSIRRPSIVEQEAARQEAFETARATGEEFDVGSFDAGPMLADGRSLGEIARAREEARSQPGYREGDFDPETMPDKIVVKRPNIEPFGDDPESFRLRAIERYDSETDTAKKTRVFTESAITKAVAPKIASPEDALLFTLSDTGRVDLDRIAAMAKSTPERVRDELGDKIFLDPASGDWKTRANYLSGNVRRKLRQAQDAAKLNPAYDINVQALEAILPQPVVSSEIRVPIGASWFPSSLYSDWAKSLGLRLSADHKETLGLWVVDGSTSEAKAKNEYGTEALPFGDLMRRVMNGKSLKVQYTVKEADGSTKTVVDDEATQAATDKAEELRRLFNDWFWSDEARASEMEGVYNEVFNAEVAPKYDGGYLTTPGIHADWSWRPHQTSVVARILQSGSTYMAHTVGAGKTSAMIGAVMEARRLGIWKKPMIVVPNHMLAQFATEFYQQYPLANILVADEKRFHTATRKQFIADVALGDWDAVIITHSGFGKIPASDRAKSAAVEDMLGDIREVLDGTGGREDKASGRGGDMATERSILGALESIASTLGVDTSSIKEKGTSTRKKIEQLLEAAEQRIARQTSDVGKDQVFDFDELGVDAMLVDEAHLFRKLSFATGKGAIKGIDPAGSIASMDLYVKARALDTLNPGRSLVLASGTPITNTMAEAYTISRYLQPDALRERGVSAFDSWAGTFGEIVSALEQTPDGGYKEVSRFAKFVNTPELSLMMRQVMDVVTGADLEKYVTRPKLKGGKRNLVVVDATSELKAYQAALGARMTAIQNRKGPVKKGDDIMLSVINDGRLAAIDMRLVDQSSKGHGSKLERMIANAFRVWKAGAEAPFYGVKKEGGYTDEPIMRGPSTQIIFATLGINGSKHNADFKIHRFIKSELVRMGVPPGDIILAETLSTHAQKARAFGDMNEGKRRILVGSKSLFTGVNAQRRLAAIHNLDPLWYPADDEQRNGRGIRQGNMNREIEIFDYSTKGTYDATMWGMMGRKAAFIEGFFRGDPDMREMEDLGEASVFEQAKAMSTSDPRILELTDLKSERDKLERRRSAAKSQRDRLAFEIRSSERQEQRLRDELVEMEQLAAKAKDLSGDKFRVTIDGMEYTERKQAGNALLAFAADIVETSDRAVMGEKVGSISGFAVEIFTSMADKSAEFTVRVSPNWNERIGFSDDPVGLMRRLEGVVTGVRGSAERTNEAIASTIRKRADLKASEANLKGFSEQAKLDEINDRIDAIEGELVAENAPAAKAEEKEMAAPSGWGEVEADPPVTDDDLLAITRDLNAEVRRTGLVGKVRLAVVRELIGTATGKPIGGRARFYLDGSTPEVSVAAGAGAGPMGALRHELIHVLRFSDLWGKEYGLFSADEWRGLVAEARKNRDIVGFVTANYAHLDNAGQSEEMVAELYRRWAASRDRSTPQAKVLRRIMAFLEAVANVLRGRGFQSAASTMEKIARGDLGGRGPDGAAPRDSRGRFAPIPIAAEMRLGLKDRIAAIWNGERPDAPVVVGPLPPVLRALSGRENTLVIPASVIRKAGSHGLTLDDVANAMEGLDDPVMVFDSTNETGNLTVLVETPAQDGRPIVVAVDAHFTAGKVQVSRIATIHGKNSVDSILGWMRNGFLRYINKGKAGGWSRSIGRQLPKDMETSHRLGKKILQHRDVFKAAPEKELRLPDVPYATTKDDFDAKERSVVSQLLTDAMGGKSPTYNLLGLVPGRALFSELGKGLPGAQRYLRFKEEMDAMRGDWHQRTDTVAQEWHRLIAQDAASNRALMDLMHDATRAGVDPSRAFKAPERRKGVLLEDHAERVRELKEAYSSLRPRFDALPKEFQKMFATVRDTYTELADAFEEAVLANAGKAMKIGLERAERAYRDEMQRIKDEGLKGDAKAEAEAEAAKKLTSARKVQGWGRNARLSQLRHQFESNRLEGPYFPLMRWGNYFVTLRDKDGRVVSFSRFESEKKQQAFVKEQKAAGLDVDFGVLDDTSGELRQQVDPNFVADIEKIIGDEMGDPDVMDMVWQRWLETLPDFSVRRSRIHRKGTPGWDGDAFRAFGRQVFHGGHQLARLTYALDMEKALEDARREATQTTDPNRAALVVNEMERRHAFTMNPTGSSVAQAITSAGFIYFLGVTPAAAAVNLTQTTILGAPILGAAFDKGGIARAVSALSGAFRDFVAGRGQAEKSRHLTGEERAAMEEAYRRGTIDKSQAHDLAGVAESGVEYSSLRMRVMKPISFLFHHAERLNREVTFLAAYRMAKDNGFGHVDAINKAADLTWKAHFDYQNTSRPRLLQNDTAKVLFLFRNFQISMIWRLFRDIHQIFNGKSEAEKREARAQVVGITAMMMLHAGITGTWGYALLMTLAGLFFPGGSDDAEEELKSAIVNTFGPGAGGLLLKGIPGHLTGIDLTNRIGMPELWFRSSDRTLEGEDQYNYWLQQFLGAAPGMVENQFRGIQQIGEGETWRGVETMAPKFIRDLMKGARFLEEGVTTRNGEPLVENVSVTEAILQALGFSMAKVSERYEANTRLKNKEQRITRERQSILADITKAMREGEQIDDSMLDDVAAFNAANPDYPITNDTILRSFRSRMRAAAEMEGGIRLNQRLDARLREEAAPQLY